MFDADVLARSYFGNSLSAYGIALAIFLGTTAIVLVATRYGLLVRLVRRRLAEGRATNFDRFAHAQIVRAIRPALIVASLLFAFSTLHLSLAARHAVQLAGAALGAWLVAHLFIGFVSLAIEEQIAYNEKRGQTAANMRAFVPFVQVLIWGIAVVFVLDSWGLHVSAIVTGLGIGGAAVALASQSLLKDWFGYLALMTDRPFEIGNLVQLTPEYSGTVLSIGVRSTRLRSISGEELTIPNSDIAAARLRNFSRMSERRVLFAFTVAGTTPGALVRRIPDAVRGAVEKQPQVRFDRATWSGFAADGFAFECAYFVESVDDGIRAASQHEINLALLDAFASLGVALIDAPLAAAPPAPPPVAPAPTQAQKNRDATLP